jgi:hypothetical protein
MQIPIVSGIYTDSGPDLRTAYPVNFFVTPKGSGISDAYLRPADGLVSDGTGPGTDRGGIEWRGTLYRVMGTSLVSVTSNGVVTVLGDVGGPTSELVTFDYSFDRLAIASGGRLYYWNGTLTQVTDPDLGTVLDFCWVDGYFMTTDGEFLVVTELTDPTQVNPLKYGSSEADPDPVVALLKLRNEVYALNRHTIEVFDNVGGDLFPFQRIDGAQVQKGVVGTFACCVFNEMIAFLGGGRNEAPGIYMGANATAQKISTDEIDRLLLTYTEAQLSRVKLEARNDKNHQLLYVHLPDRTVVFDLAATQALNQPIWTTMTSATAGFAQYRARNFIWAYNRWNVGDPASSTIGYCVDTRSDHWGQIVRWEFGTIIVYNQGNGALFHELELVALTGRVALGLDPQISTSYSVDGSTWGQDHFIRAGTIGNRAKRLVWLRQGNMRNWRMQRFRGDSQAHLAFARLEAQIEPLAY